MELSRHQEKGLQPNEQQLKVHKDVPVPEESEGFDQYREIGVGLENVSSIKLTGDLQSPLPSEVFEDEDSPEVNQNSPENSDIN